MASWVHPGCHERHVEVTGSPASTLLKILSQNYHSHGKKKNLNIFLSLSTFCRSIASWHRLALIIPWDRTEGGWIFSGFLSTAKCVIEEEKGKISPRHGVCTVQLGGYLEYALES